LIRRDPKSSLFFSLGLAAALLALCLRLMAPVGWMPAASANGVTFTLCSGNGDQQVISAKDGQPAAPDTASGHAGPCAFSGMATPALSDLPPTVALQIFALFIALGLAATPRLRLAAATWLRPPLRGPPTAA
jgi:hypothetical protein